MRIAIVTAMAEESLPIYKKLGNVVAEDTISGTVVRQIEIENHTLYLATSGIGEVRAALAVQMLVDLFDIELVLNFGFVGALNPELNIGDLVIGEKVCHHQFDITAVNNTKIGQYDGKDDVFFVLSKSLVDKIRSAITTPLRLVAIASGDKFIATKQDKEFLRNQFGADICEMEMLGIALACERNNLPVFSLKVVSDKADESAIESFAEVLSKGLTKYEKVLPQILSVLSMDKKPMPPAKN